MFLVFQVEVGSNFEKEGKNQTGVKIRLCNGKVNLDVTAALVASSHY